jgi:hypothetical protein
MSIEYFINKLTQYFSQLYYRRWEKWELLTIALVALLPLLFLLRAQQKRKVRKKHEHDYASIIGKKLTDHSQEQ